MDDSIQTLKLEMNKLLSVYEDVSLQPGAAAQDNMQLSSGAADLQQRPQQLLPNMKPPDITQVFNLFRRGVRLMGYKNKIFERVSLLGARVFLRNLLNQKARHAHCSY